ncbi:hypothetical protein RND81_09G158000 [Saponaria officinalis]|uniref:Uncharacterized protein n=1 Tax=Saponaria officinalis TaxID=3572 RepID=A0AAW1INB9_SAPOF
MFVNIVVMRKNVFDHLVIKGSMRDFEKWYNIFDCESTLGSHEDNKSSIIAAHDSMLEILGDAFEIHSSTSNLTPRTLHEAFDFSGNDQEDNHVNIREETHDSLSID